MSLKTDGRPQYWIFADHRCPASGLGTSGFKFGHASCRWGRIDTNTITLSASGNQFDRIAIRVESTVLTDPPHALQNGASSKHPPPVDGGGGSNRMAFHNPGTLASVDEPLAESRQSDRVRIKSSPTSRRVPEFGSDVPKPDADTVVRKYQYCGRPICLEAHRSTMHDWKMLKVSRF